MDLIVCIRLQRLFFPDLVISKTRVEGCGWKLVLDPERQYKKTVILLKPQSKRRLANPKPFYRFLCVTINRIVWSCGAGSDSSVIGGQYASWCGCSATLGTNCS